MAVCDFVLAPLSSLPHRDSASPIMKRSLSILRTSAKQLHPCPRPLSLLAPRRTLATISNAHKSLLEGIDVHTDPLVVSPSADLLGFEFSSSEGGTEKEAVGRPIYLDMQATTPTDPRVLDAMLPFMTNSYGNPHSKTHAYGWESEKAVEEGRKVSAQHLWGTFWQLGVGRGARRGRGRIGRGNRWEDKCWTDGRRSA